MSIADTVPIRPDVRCEATFAPLSVGARCQLMAGHEGSHASLGVSHGAQAIWLWDGAHHAHAERYRSELGAGRPWAPGLPEPEFTFGI